MSTVMDICDQSGGSKFNFTARRRRRFGHSIMSCFTITNVGRTNCSALSPGDGNDSLWYKKRSVLAFYASSVSQRMQGRSSVAATYCSFLHLVQHSSLCGTGGHILIQSIAIVPFPCLCAPNLPPESQAESPSWGKAVAKTSDETVIGACHGLHCDARHHRHGKIQSHTMLSVPPDRTHIGSTVAIVAVVGFAWDGRCNPSPGNDSFDLVTQNL